MSNQTCTLCLEDAKGQDMDFLDLDIGLNNATCLTVCTKCRSYLAAIAKHIYATNRRNYMQGRADGRKQASK